MKIRFYKKIFARRTILLLIYDSCVYIFSGTCWMVYGYLKKDKTVEYVTFTQIVLYSVYTVFYWIMTKKKVIINWIPLQLDTVNFSSGSQFTLWHWLLLAAVWLPLSTSSDTKYSIRWAFCAWRWIPWILARR